MDATHAAAFRADVLRPAGALTLVALGFAMARMLPMARFRIRRAVRLCQRCRGCAAHVRYVERGRRAVCRSYWMKRGSGSFPGSLDDQQIRALLLSAAKDPSDPGLRAETVDILNMRAQSADVRDALIFAVQHDSNAGVRMKAMDGLKPFVRDPEVRTALTQVLLSDSNPGLRTQAIDLLTGAAQCGVQRPAGPAD